MVKENGMVMMTEQEHALELDIICKDYEREIKTLKEDYEKRLEFLQEAVKQLMVTRTTSTADIKVGKRDFLAIYNKALDEMCSSEDNYIYGHDITVHWHGIYCNCGDGAVPSNYIIPSIKEMLDEDDDEY